MGWGSRPAQELAVEAVHVEGGGQRDTRLIGADPAGAEVVGGLGLAARALVGGGHRLLGPQTVLAPQLEDDLARDRLVDGGEHGVVEVGALQLDDEDLDLGDGLTGREPQRLLAELVGPADTLDLIDEPLLEGGAAALASAYRRSFGMTRSTFAASGHWIRSAIGRLGLDDGEEGDQLEVVEPLEALLQSGGLRCRRRGCRCPAAR